MTYLILTTTKYYFSDPGCHFKAVTAEAVKSVANCRGDWNTANWETHSAEFKLLCCCVKVEFHILRVIYSHGRALGTCITCFLQLPSSKLALACAVTDVYVCMSEKETDLLRVILWWSFTQIIYWNLTVSELEKSSLQVFWFDRSLLSCLSVSFTAQNTFQQHRATLWGRIRHLFPFSFFPRNTHIDCL